MERGVAKTPNLDIQCGYLKFEDSFLIPKLKVSLQGMIITGYR